MKDPNFVWPENYEQYDAFIYYCKDGCPSVYVRDSIKLRQWAINRYKISVGLDGYFQIEFLIRQSARGCLNIFSKEQPNHNFYDFLNKDTTTNK
jgi:hypothetical protein